MEWQGGMGMGESWGKNIPDRTPSSNSEKYAWQVQEWEKKNVKMAIGLKVLYMTVRASWYIVLPKSSVS